MSRPGTPGEQGWTRDEVEALVRAVEQAPSVHNIRPWSLAVSGRLATLSERSDLSLPRHDAEGRDRLISCGAALANLVLAVRSTGWTAAVRRDEAPDAVATVAGEQRAEPTPVESARHQAIERRASYRRPFPPDSVSESERDSLLAAVTAAGVRARWVAGERDASEFARLLGFAARAFHGDREYQRELAMWTVGSDSAEALGLRRDAMGRRGLPAVGLVTATTRLPDERVLAEWIAAESVLILTTATDSRLDCLCAGEAMQLAWLEATNRGLGASVMTQPLHLSEVRSALQEKLELAALPQVIMRFGRSQPETTA